MFPYSLQLLLEIRTTIKRITLPGSAKESVVPGSRNSKARVWGMSETKSRKANKG